MKGFTDTSVDKILSELNNCQEDDLRVINASQFSTRTFIQKVIHCQCF